MDILRNAITLYAGPQDAMLPEIERLRAELYAVLCGKEIELEDTVITSDPPEDSDDQLMIRYIIFNNLNRGFIQSETVQSETGKIYIILSGGIYTSDERLTHMKTIFPELNAIQFGVPFGRVTFLRDGVDFMEPVKCFVNCGPCHSKTLLSIFKRLNESRGRMITVGANADGTAAGINQKNTDEGTLKDLHWNEYVATLKDVTIKNLDVGVSRYVLMPHPSRISGAYGSMPAACFDDIVYTTGMFFSSRPPPKFALRVNEGNSIVVSQLIDVMAYQGTPAFEYGLEMISKYAAICPTYEIASSAAIPLMATALMGGVYKESVFGFDPKDKTARRNVSCLTPDSAQVFIANIRKLEKFTPGYDLSAVILAKQ